ncbi:MAG: hypothetical protein J6R22_05065 [Alphaproteobacteria bacterium]|nr:hypothetical protein [Alphaproteobacteria bacterium]
MLRTILRIVVLIVFVAAIVAVVQHFDLFDKLAYWFGRIVGWFRGLLASL